MARDEDLQRMRSLHRRLLAAQLKACLRSADPDLQEFAQTLPDQVTSAESHLRSFWQQKGWDEDQVQAFAVRFGRTLAACPQFQRFEREMEELAGLAGDPQFGGRLADVAAGYGITAADL